MSSTRVTRNEAFSPVMVFDDFNSCFFFCHKSSIDTHIDTNQLILLSQARTQKTKKSVADGHLTSSKEV